MVEVDNRPWGPRPVEMININKIQNEAEVVPSSSLVEVEVGVEVEVEVNGWAYFFCWMDGVGGWRIGG